MRGLRLGRYVAIAAIAGCLVMLVGPAPAAAPRFVVGFDDDLAKQPGTPVAPALRQLGATAERITLQWSPGVTTLSSADSAGLDRAVAASSGLRLLLTVYGTSGTAAPVSSTARSQYCAYVSSALRHSPQIRDVVIWNEPNKSQFWSPQLGSGTAPAAPAAYETLLATCYDVLHGSFPTINVLGLALAHNGNDNASGTSPGAFIRNLGTAYRASGRRARLLDTIAYHPYPATNAERPWLQHIGSTTIGEGDWNKLMYNLWQAFNGTAQPIPGHRRRVDLVLRVGRAVSDSGREGAALLGHRERPGRARAGGRRSRLAAAARDEPRPGPGDAGSRCGRARRLPAERDRVLQLPDRRRADARRLAVRPALRRPQRQGVVSRIRTGDLCSLVRNTRLLEADGRPAEQRLPAAGDSGQPDGHRRGHAADRDAAVAAGDRQRLAGLLPRLSRVVARHDRHHDVVVRHDRGRQ